MSNFMLMTDGYKIDHRRQYPPNTQRVFSNFTARKGRDGNDKGIIFFGLRYVLQKYFVEVANETFFNRPKHEVVDEYQRFLDSYLGPNDVGTEHIAALHDLGYLPLEINALNEGSFVPYGVPFMTIENTHDEFFWVTNYIETLLSSALWHACTSATTAWKYRKILSKWAQKTDPSNAAFVDWQAHDFSFRGHTSPESASLSGAAHLLSFNGTDTIPSLGLLESYYDGQGLIGGSVPATEHSVMCAGGQDDELETFNRLLDLYPNGILSVVSDTWDYWNVITNVLPKLKDKIMSRNGKLVVRPDSGDPYKIIVGDSAADWGTDQFRGTVDLLWDLFGGVYAADDYRVLDPHVGVIYGDSITLDLAEAICKGLASRRFASTNVVFGVGSYTYQHVTRDTHGFAIKATWAKIDGKEHQMFKRPKTDSGAKFSARGKLAVIKRNESLELWDGLSHREYENAMYVNEMTPVWMNGLELFGDPLDEIRARVRGNV